MDFYHRSEYLNSKKPDRDYYFHWVNGVPFNASHPIIEEPSGGIKLVEQGRAN
jgi:hypothetical protein